MTLSCFDNQVVSLRDQLSEATDQINGMTGEYLAVKDSSQQQKHLVEKVTGENLKLRSIVEEHVQEKKRRDSQLDHIEKEVPTRS